MVEEYLIFVWVAVGVASAILVSRLVVLPFAKEYRSTRKVGAKIKQDEVEDINEKKFTGLAAGAAVNYVDNMLKNLERGYKEAKEVYDKQQAECVRQGRSPEETEKILAPLRAKMKQAEWLIQNRDALSEVNRAMTAPVIGRLAKKFLGGLM